MDYSDGSSMTSDADFAGTMARRYAGFCCVGASFVKSDFDQWAFAIDGRRTFPWQKVFAEAIHRLIDGGALTIVVVSASGILPSHILLLFRT